MSLRGFAISIEIQFAQFRFFLLFLSLKDIQRVCVYVCMYMCIGGCVCVCVSQEKIRRTVPKIDMRIVADSVTNL